jgi:hypothetical protein
MQQTIGLKRFVVTHVGPIVVAFGILIVVALGTAGLGATGNLPWTADTSSSNTVSQPAVVAAASEDRSAQIQLMRSFYQHKEARMEADELARSTIAHQVDRQDALRRYVEHKEKTFDEAR